MASRKGLSLFFILLAWLPTGRTVAQNAPHFSHLTREEGLSQSTVFDVLQDRTGFMWIATQDGLNQFDGYRFRIFKHNPRDPNSLGDSFVRALTLDAAGRLWMTTNNRGLNLWIPEEQSFRHFTHDPADPTSISSNSTMCCLSDSAGNLWVGTFDSGLNLLRWDAESGPAAFRRFQHDSLSEGSISGNNISALFSDRSGMLWVGTYDSGLNRLDPAAPEKGFQRFRHRPGDRQSLSDDNITSISADEDGYLWIGTRAGGINRFDPSTGTFRHFRQREGEDSGLLNDNVRAIFYEGKTENRRIYWVGTWGSGLHQMIFEDPEGQPLWRNFHHQADDRNSLSDDFIFKIFRDRSNTLWITTNRAGINLKVPFTERFRHYRSESDNPGSLSANGIWSFWEDRAGNLWIGTEEGGLNQLRPGARSFRHFRHDPGKPNSLSNNSVISIREDVRNPGVLWLATLGGGLDRFDSRKETFTHFPYDPADDHGIGTDNLLTLFQDSSGVLWIGTFDAGLVRFDPAAASNKQFRHFRHDPDNPNSPGDNYICKIVKDRRGNFWLGTFDSGVNRLIPGKAGEPARFKRYVHDPENPNTPSNNIVATILEDRFQPDILWIGSQGGLSRLDSREEIFTHYYEQDGLPNQVIYGILQDDDGHLWLSTNLGLSRFSPSTGAFRNYDAGDGLQANEFNFSAFHRGHSGRFYFGGENGFNAFWPAQIVDNPYRPPVVITSIKTFDREVARDIAGPEGFSFGHDQKYLTFEFAALNYFNSGKNRYAYRMNGFDDDWIDAGTRRFASYTNLPPGRYNFRVKGSNNDGIWNEEGVAIDIHILPPLWRTWWAYLLYLVLAAGLLLAWRRYDLQRLRLKAQLQLEKAQSEKLKELDNVKSNFFANISHEFRTPLTLILAPLESALNSMKADFPLRTQLKTAHRNAGRLLHLINQVMDLSRFDARMMRLQPQRQDLIPFLKNIFYSFETAFEARGIPLQFESRFAHLDIDFDPAKLEQVFYNLLSNALKFAAGARGGPVVLRVALLRGEQPQPGEAAVQMVSIFLTDQGPGIAEEDLAHVFDRFYQANDGSGSGSGIGLALAREIVRLHGGEITVASTLGMGTTFAIRLPVCQDGAQTGGFAATPGGGYPLPETAAMVAEGSLPLSQDGEQVILIVEDNPEMGLFLSRQLSDPYQVLNAGNGREGLEIAREHIPDLIISDVMMPEMDGYRFCEAIRSDLRTSHIPVILLTAKASVDNRISGLATGADDYIAKPFNVQELLVRIGNLLEQRRRLRERYARQITLQPEGITVTSMDEQFLNRVREVVEANLGDEHFSVEDLAREAGMSRVQLHRKLKALTDQPASQFILSMRIQRAADLIGQGAGTIAEIAYQTGFNTPNYFAKCFRKLMGCSPSEYKTRQQ